VVEGWCGVQLDGPRAGLFNDMHRYQDTAISSARKRQRAFLGLLLWLLIIMGLGCAGRLAI
jgi:hypothetical protein